MDPRRGEIPLHPEAVAGDPSTLRWVVADLPLPFTGPVSAAPGALGAQLSDGVLAAVTLEPGAVVVTLADGLDWRSSGPAVRTALHAALLDPAAWLPAEVPVGVPDREPVDVSVARTVREALAGEAGAFVRSHGGAVELVDVTDRVVTLRLSGSCRGCPALGFTVGRRLEGQLRKVCPLVREVRAVA
jgi:NFU1 iron-sulfur cluster scaffold homolog, mitochondrial